MTILSVLKGEDEVIRSEVRQLLVRGHSDEVSRRWIGQQRGKIATQG